MKIMLLLLIYVIECVRYRVGNYVLFQSKIDKGNTKIAAGMAVCFAVSVFAPVNDTGKLVITTGISVTVTFLCMIGETSVRMVHLIWNLLMLTCMDGIFGSIINFTTVEDETIQNYIEYLASDSITLLMLALLYIFVKGKKGRSLEWIDRATQNSVHIGIGITAIGIIFTVTALNYAKKYIYQRNFLSVIDIICGIGYAGMCILIYFVIYIRAANVKMQRLLEVEETLRKMQINNYQILLKKEEDTRRFRHDMNNHLICLGELLKKDKKEDVENYLNQIYENLKAVQEEGYVTGNEVLDAVLNYYIGKLDSKVNVEISGKCMGVIDASEYSLCTIFGNLIQNAVEELERFPVKKRYIKVHMKTGRKYVEILFYNTTDKKRKLKTTGDGLLGVETAKEDKKIMDTD